MNSISALQLFNILRFGTTLLTQMLLANSGLPMGEISLYELLLLLANLVSFFWVMGGQNAFLQYFPKLNLDESGNIATTQFPKKNGLSSFQKKALFNAFLLFTLLSGLAAVTLWTFRFSFFDHFNEGEPVPHLQLICWFIVFNTPAFLIHIYYLVLERFKVLLAWGFFTFFGQLLAVVVPIFLGYSLEVSFQVLVGLAILRYAWGMQILGQHAQFQVDFSFLKKYAWLIVPLMLHSLLGNSVEYTDSLIVKAYFSDEDTFAIFRYGAKELPIALLFVGAVVTAMIPKLVENQELGLQLMKQKTNQLASWLYPLSMVLMLLSPLLFPLFYTKSFAPSAQIFNVYLLVLSSRILLPQVVVLSHQKNFILVVFSVIELLINVVLSLLFVRSFGLVGIAFASVIAFLMFKIMLIIYSQIKLKVSLTQYISVGKYLFWNALLFGSYGLAEIIY